MFMIKHLGHWYHADCFKFQVNHDMTQVGKILCRDSPSPDVQRELQESLLILKNSSNFDINDPTILNGFNLAIDSFLPGHAIDMYLGILSDPFSDPFLSTFSLLMKIPPSCIKNVINFIIRYPFRHLTIEILDPDIARYYELHGIRYDHDMIRICASFGLCFMGRAIREQNDRYYDETKYLTDSIYG